jgi:hypothetical protein
MLDRRTFMQMLGAIVTAATQAKAIPQPTAPPPAPRPVVKGGLLELNYIKSVRGAKPKDRFH